VVRSMRATDEQVDEIVKHIDAYLEGSCAGTDTARWAAQQLGENTFSSAEILLQEALSALTMVGFEEPAYDTPREELVQIRSALKGEADYLITLSLRWAPKPSGESSQRTHRG